MSKTKKVDLFIKVFQNLKGNIRDEFELFTTGKLKQRKNGYIIEYENEYNGVSTIALKDNRSVDIVANGDIFYILNLNEKKHTKFSCNTKDTFSYFNVSTRNIFFEIGEEDGRIEFEYDLEIDNLGGMLGNRIDISFRAH